MGTKGQQGGYQAPNNPAPVSGPSGLSKRTDGGPTQGAKYISGLPYGQGGETYSNQVAAPMAGNNMGSAAMGDSGLVQMEMPTELMAPTARPNEAITSGIDTGEGPGSAALNLPAQQASLAATLQQLIQYDPTGEAELAYRMIVDSGSMG